MDVAKISRELLDFIDVSPTCYQVAANFARMLDGMGFEHLNEAREWSLEADRGYYVTRNGSSLAAFKTPCNPIRGMQIAAAHGDSPLLKVKPNALLDFEGSYVRLNVEKYGGLACARWLDRPLSIAGRCVVRTPEGMKAVNIDLREPVAIIPSLAVHMDRNADKGREYSAQSDLPPLIGDADAGERFERALAAAAGAESKADIIGCDLFCYSCEPGRIWGLDGEFVSSRQLDDLQCAWTCMKAFCESTPAPDRLTLCAVFDNEEVGSATKQGADSSFLPDVLQRINAAFGRRPEQLQTLLANTLMVSADNAHGVHPGNPTAACPGNRPVMNGGVVIKHSANQRYASDAVSAAAFKLYCERAQVPYQDFANHSDIPGGSTLGNISSTHVSVNCVDVGLAQLAMHSPCETAGTRDTLYLLKAMREFFSGSFCDTGDGGFAL